MSIQEILESAGLPAQRGVYTGRDKPDAYYTFLRLLGTPAVNADDEEKERREMYRVNEALLAEDENAQLLEEKRVGRLIHAGNLQEVQNAIFKSFYRGTAGDNSDTENENDGEETTEEGNRAAVQEN